MDDGLHPHTRIDEAQSGPYADSLGWQLAVRAYFYAPGSSSTRGLTGKGMCSSPLGENQLCWLVTGVVGTASLVFTLHEGYGHIVRPYHSCESCGYALGPKVPLQPEYWNNGLRQVVADSYGIELPAVMYPGASVQPDAGRYHSHGCPAAFVEIPELEHDLW